MLKLCLILTLTLIQANAFDAPYPEGTPGSPCNYNSDCNKIPFMPWQGCVVNPFTVSKQVLELLVKIGNILKKKFLIQGQEIAEISPFPVLILFPVTTNFWSSW